MTYKECKSLILLDLYRLSGNNGGGKCRVLRYLFTNASFKITFWMRVGGWLKSSKNLFCRVCSIVVFAIHKHNQYKTGIQISIGHSIGGGLCFPHFGGIVINSGAKIGKNCTILQGVTIGSIRGPKGGCPTIGDNVVIAAGSAVIGNVNIGNNVMVGAHSLVLKDVPDGAVVVGNPARIINMNGADNVKFYIN